MAAVARASGAAAPTSEPNPPASSGRSFVPIRPAFRPLLPKPSANSQTHSQHQDSEPTVVVKSQVQMQVRSSATSKVFKKRRSDPAVSVSGLPSTVAPSSLVTKRRKSPVLEVTRNRKLRIDSRSPSESAATSPQDDQDHEHDDMSDHDHLSDSSIAAPLPLPTVSKPPSYVNLKDLKTINPGSLTGLSDAEVDVSETGEPDAANHGLFSPESLVNMDGNPVLSDSPVSMNFELKLSSVGVDDYAGVGAGSAADSGTVTPLVLSPAHTEISLSVSEPLQDLGPELWPSVSVKSLADQESFALGGLADMDVGVDDALSADTYFAAAANDEDDPAPIDLMDFFGPAMDIF